jgi:hypothetical protein
VYKKRGGSGSKKKQENKQNMKGKKQKNKKKKPKWWGRKKENKMKGFHIWQLNLFALIKFTQPHQMVIKMDSIAIVGWRTKWVWLLPLDGD